VTPALALGRAFSCSLSTRGAVRCWGANDVGQRGGDGLAGVLALAAGPEHACAVLADGPRCWGKNHQGQLGDGTRDDRRAPVAVRLPGRHAAHLDPSKTTPVLTRDASCFLWSEEYSGSFAACTGALRDAAVFSLAGRGPEPPCLPRSLCAKVYGLQAAAFDASLCTTSLTNDVPRVHCPVGPKALAPRQPEPVYGATDDGKTVWTIALGRAFGCGLGGGGVLCWGSNARGQLGAAHPASSTEPRPVPGLAGADAICAGAEHACARLPDGRVLCWGSNARGQLGNREGAPAGAVEIAAARGAAAIGCGEAHACAQLAAGRVVCWGANDAGHSSGRGGQPIAAPGEVSLPR
jgi:alpha-tubulin suppressor-like RCC1 family protein